MTTNLSNSCITCKQPCPDPLISISSPQLNGDNRQVFLCSERCWQIFRTQNFSDYHGLNEARNASETINPILETFCKADHLS